ncbi:MULTISPECIES: hypothetical protein [unclassified Paenibacillus]|uniref:hypothetical protein n=1 Tax=unclassified Paenibacillus TaxID=185978 RepID=UPI0003E23A5D|nr:MULTISPECIES: hypothetical protein [unclassified Paenibacillus]ETT45566.1 hypothetical protein C162_20876 [Paenibacillus sp. FSL R7-269]OMF85898.1 hypothetical protein BK147_31220 [Paenibacillus sp. FSL R7-0337]
MILLRSKRIKIITFSTILIFALVVLILYLSYAKQTNAVLVKYSRMNQIAPNVFVEPEINESEKAELIHFVQISSAKINVLFGPKESAPVVIYAKSKKALDNYADSDIGQTYYYPWNNYIVIGSRGYNENVIAHEFTHAELRKRLKNSSKVPVWFDEGLAAMVDGRFTDNEKTWKIQTKDGKESINFDLLDSHSAFQPNAQSRMNYELACYEVSRWYGIVGTPGLLKLLDSLNEGEEFIKVYKGIESNMSDEARGGNLY